MFTRLLFPHNPQNKNIFLLLVLVISTFILLGSVAMGLFIGYALVLVWGILAWTVHKIGYSYQSVWDMSKKGLLTSLNVLQIFLFIGLLTALWQASGTMPAIITYGLDLIQPKLFVLSAFLLPSLVSYLIGTSLGTVGTVGLALIIMARAGNVPQELVAGAIIAGAYVGDRGSPMSSSAALVATLTHTKVPDNLIMLLRSSIPALVLSSLLYLIASFIYPLDVVQSDLPTLIHEAFFIDPLLLLPAGIMILLVLAKAPVKFSILLSTICAAILAYMYQGYSATEIARFSILGFHLTGHEELAAIIHGGGLLSMVGPSIAIIVACAISSLIEEAGLLNKVHYMLERYHKRSDLFAANIVLSLLTSAIGCSQSVASVMTYYMMRTTYAREKVHDQQMALDFENSGIVLSALVPWSIAAFVPTVMLGTSFTGYLPFAFFLYLLPLTHWGLLRYKEKHRILR